MMWGLMFSVLLAASSIGAENEETLELNTRTARFARGELPLLLIRPINNDGAQITAEDIGKLLPQLGLDRSSYSFPKYNAPKPNYSYKPEHAKPFYPSKDPAYLKEQEQLRQIYQQQQQQKKQQQPQQHYQQQQHYQHLQQQQQQHHQQQQEHQQPEQPQQHHQQQEHQQHHHQQPEQQHKPNYPKNTENRFYIPHQSENYPQNSYVIQKQNQYPREEVVVGKPGISYHENYHTPQKNDFYVPKDEHIASFEVKSKAEFHPHPPSSIKSYDYTPKVINTITAEDASNSYNFSPEKHQYQKQQQKHSLFNQAPQIEYFIPKEQEHADVQVHSVASADEKDYFGNLKTDEYFLPKFEPEYHTNSPKYPQRHQQFRKPSQVTDYPILNQNVAELIDKYAYEYLQNSPIKLKDSENHSEDSYSKPDSYLNLKPDYEDENEEEEETDIQFNPESYVREAQHQQTRQLQPHALQLKSAEVRPVNEYSDDVTTKRVVKPRIQTEAPQTNTPAPVKTEVETEKNIFSQNLFEAAPDTTKRFTTPKTLSFKSRLSRSTVAPSKFQVKSSEPTIMVSGPGCERQCIRNTASKEYEPVCGSDGKTYSNKGKLNCVQQCSDSEITVKHVGGCGKIEARGQE